MVNLGILISGRGSNMESILKAIKKQKIPIAPKIVISNNPDAKGLKIAQKLGVATKVIQSKGFTGTRWEYDQKIIQVLEENGVTPKNGLVCLAGFMRIISSEFSAKYKNRIINIHPALLPAFPGLHAQRQALEHGVKYSGCTVHYVDSGVDTGPIILQEIVPVKDGDTEETLSKRILAKEHIAYVKAVKLIAQGKVKIAGRTTSRAR
ncbi:MAG: phosphoribosylglycinamide formyltransferase [Nitrososphaeria archaeon]|nr:phosphoribosylglycinamide formyltransferase [Nitrososphaeria archaeon]NDB50827.1 phosphoribosylglycinamide formyltransferase [Nitrosopumilaceae archaeon]NDB89553.1 phosphoribosylglycinamide formyltransferase [Nitrososphaerota archaeon]NDB91193.1 phosphoribosylglycinamide formyltransferase [Nitrososphaeria archaeon]NDF29060.1 phosphoribosylglycinamide formyltransferase [Nitrososphaeria archaeon]